MNLKLNLTIWGMSPSTMHEGLTDQQSRLNGSYSVVAVCVIILLLLNQPANLAGCAHGNRLVARQIGGLYT